MTQNRHVDSSDSENDSFGRGRGKADTRIKISSDDGYQSNKKSENTMKKGVRRFKRWNRMSSKESKKILTRPFKRIFNDTLSFAMHSLGTVNIKGSYKPLLSCHLWYCVLNRLIILNSKINTESFQE